jgi:S1-C subfamily serine protease
MLTDAPTGPGYSGAPVVNDRGALVGVVAAQVRDANVMSLCVDVAEVRGMLDAYTLQSGVKPALAAGSELPAGKSVAQPRDDQQLQGGSKE